MRKELFLDLGSKLVPRVREGGMFHPTTTLLTVSITKTFLANSLDVSEAKAILAGLPAVEAENTGERWGAVGGGG